MKTKAKIFLLGLIALFFILSSSFNREYYADSDLENIEIEFDENEPSKNKVLMDMVTDGLQRSHYAPATLNDSYSEKVYRLYLERIDINKRFLLQSFTCGRVLRIPQFVDIQQFNHRWPEGVADHRNDDLIIGRIECVVWRMYKV